MSGRAHPVTITTSFDPPRSRADAWKQFWQFEAFVAIACAIGFLAAMAYQDTWRLWMGGERAKAVVLEFHDGPAEGDAVTWVRIGERGIWVIDENLHRENGDELDVVFDPNDRTKASEASYTGETFALGVVVAAVPFVGLIVGGARQLHLDRVGRRAARRRE